MDFGIFQKILLFIAMLFPLVFVHELGHFLFAKLFGVRVETFSIGFGPKLFKFTWKETEYAWSLIPLGGYVKLYGDNPLEPEIVPEDQRHKSFVHQGKWGRFWIAFGGPLFNFIFTFTLYFILFGVGHKTNGIYFQTPSSELLALADIVPQDRLVKINGEEVQGPEDFSAFSHIETIEVERPSLQTGRLETKLLTLKSKLELSSFLSLLFKNHGPLTTPLFVNEKGESFFLAPNKSDNNQGFLFSQFSWEKLSFSSENWPLALYKKEENTNSFIQLIDSPIQIQNLGLYPLELVVKNVAAGTPADLLGIQKGDILLSFQGKKLDSFTQLRTRMNESEDSLQKFSLEVLRPNQGNLVFEVIPQDSKTLHPITKKPLKIIGVESSFMPFLLAPIMVKAQGFSIISKAFQKTWKNIINTLEMFKRLLSRQLSVKAVGGPLSIGKVASDSYELGLGHFFQIMALLSISLGVINLFPVPVLDGGHILFIFLEFLYRKPLPKKALEISQSIGLGILILLMGLSLYNDITNLFR